MGRMENHLQVVENAGVPPDEIRAAIDAVLASYVFRRSERLARFLRYVCETTLDGHGQSLNEVLIAHEVFERGADYSPGEDSVVRRQAHSLRQKLQEYYSSEGQHDRVRIELPIGRYVPVFSRGRAAEPPVVTASPAVPQFRRRTQPMLLTAVLMGVVFLAGWWVGNRSPSGPKPAFPAAVNEIWSAWFADPSGAVICFSSPVTAVVKQFSEKLPPDSLPKRITMSSEMAQEFREALNLPPGGYFYLSPTLTQSKTGEAIGAVALTGLLVRANLPVRTTQSRFLSWEDFRNENLVLLGHDEANRWLDPILGKLPLRLAATEADRPRRIVNTAPKAGEQAEYRLEARWPTEAFSGDYALVSMLGGIDGQHQLLLVNGLNTEGTQVALEYLTTPSALRDLAGALRAMQPGHRGAWHFQMVLHTEVRDKVPTRAERIALRILP
jgi:hypothetical protein